MGAGIPFSFPIGTATAIAHSTGATGLYTGDFGTRAEPTIIALTIAARGRSQNTQAIIRLNLSQSYLGIGASGCGPERSKITAKLSSRAPPMLRHTPAPAKRRW